jgi:hypothetical protein
MKPLPALSLNVKLWLHSDIHLGFFFLDPEDIKSLSLGSSATLAKEQVSPELVSEYGAKKGPVFIVTVRDRTQMLINQ